MKKHVFLVAWIAVLVFIQAGFAVAEPENEELDRCMCLETLSRVLCKSVGEFSYIGYKQGAYYFNVFYGSKHSNFQCRVRPLESNSGLVLVSSKTWLRLQRSVQYSYNATTHTMGASMYNPECPRPAFQCSRDPRPEELEAQKEDAFWYRPIPKELLGVDQKGGTDNETVDDMDLPEALKPSLP